MLYCGPALLGHSPPVSIDAQVNLVVWHGKRPHRSAAVEYYCEERALEAIRGGTAVAVGRPDFSVVVAEGCGPYADEERSVSLNALMATKQAFHQWSQEAHPALVALARLLWKDVATDPRPCIWAAYELARGGQAAVDVAVQLRSDRSELTLEELVELSLLTTHSGALPSLPEPF